MDNVTLAELAEFRRIADRMSAGELCDWEWVGPHAFSQRMVGISQSRAKEYAAKHGGIARRTPPLGCVRYSVNRMQDLRRMMVREIGVEGWVRYRDRIPASPYDASGHRCRDGRDAAAATIRASRKAAISLNWPD